MSIGGQKRHGSSTSLHRAVSSEAGYSSADVEARGQPAAKESREGRDASNTPGPQGVGAARGALALTSAVLYGATAISMNFVNKGTLSYFPLGNTVLLLQMLAVVPVVLPLRAYGCITLQPLSWQRAWALLPVTILYVANVGFALLGLAKLNVPMYNTLKRLTPIMVLGVKAYCTKTQPPLNTTASVLLTVAGCVVAGLGDLSFDITGYSYALASCLLQASYLLLVERSGAERGVSTAELLLYNALLSLPFLLLVIAATGEAAELLGAMASACAQLSLAGFAALMAACSLMGMLLNYSQFLCTMYNSALTTTIVGVLKGVLATGLGFFLLGGVPFSWLNLFGIALNTSGGVWYTVIKYNERRAKAALANKDRAVHAGNGHSAWHSSESRMQLARQEDEQAPLLPASSRPQLKA